MENTPFYPPIESDNIVEQKELESGCSTDSSEDLEEYSDDNHEDEVEIENDGGLASIAIAVLVEKEARLNAEFLNNPISFNDDKTWLEEYQAIELTNERQFARSGPATPNGEWKDLIFSDCIDAWQWIEEHINDDREYWALAFDGGRRYGVMTTNWSESLNSVLRGTRSLPITAFVAATFYRVNQAFVDRNEEGRKLPTQLCPKALAKIRTQQLAARGYQVTRFGPCEYDVNTGTSTYPVTVNRRLSKCVCQVFEFTGLPCSHMLAACSSQWHGTDFHTLCDDWYCTEKYRNAYSVQFHPVPDKRLWPSFEGQIVLPPALRKMKGRPKSSRIRNSMDWREESDTTKCKCSQCSELGHYKKKCPQLRKNVNSKNRGSIV